MTKTLVIPPTIGRRVLVFVAAGALDGQHCNSPSVPFEGGIAYIHSADAIGGSMVNVGYTDHNGVAHSATSVRLYDRAQEDSDAHGKIGATYAVWMPYQFEQALRAREPKSALGRPADVELRKLGDGEAA